MIDILRFPEWIPEIYNYSNEGEISWHEFALSIKEFGGYSCYVGGISSASYPTPARRPEFSLLDKNKIKKIYGVDISNYKKSLKKCLYK